MHSQSGPSVNCCSSLMVCRRLRCPSCVNGFFESSIFVSNSNLFHGCNITILLRNACISMICLLLQVKWVTLIERSFWSHSYFFNKKLWTNLGKKIWKEIGKIMKISISAKKYLFGLICKILELAIVCCQKKLIICLNSIWELYRHHSQISEMKDVFFIINYFFGLICKKNWTNNCRIRCCTKAISRLRGGGGG